MSGVDAGALTHSSYHKNLVISIDEACIEMLTWWYRWRRENFQKWYTDNCRRSLAHLSISIVQQKIHYLLSPGCALTQRQALDNLFSTREQEPTRGPQQISVTCSQPGSRSPQGGLSKFLWPQDDCNIMQTQRAQLENSFTW